MPQAVPPVPGINNSRRPVIILLLAGVSVGAYLGLALAGDLRQHIGWYLAVFGMAALIWAGIHLIGDWSIIDHGQLLREFLLPIWMTPIALLFVYGFAVFAAYQSTFKMMRLSNDEPGRQQETSQKRTQRCAEYKTDLGTRDFTRSAPSSTPTHTLDLSVAPGAN